MGTRAPRRILYMYSRGLRTRQGVVVRFFVKNNPLSDCIVCLYCRSWPAELTCWLKGELNALQNEQRAHRDILKSCGKNRHCIYNIHPR